MLTILICAFVGGLIAFADFRDFVDFFAGAFMGAIFGLFAALIVGGIAYSDSVPYKLKPVPLESLVDGSDTRGSFFLGSGTINDVAVYTWYEQNGENSYVQRQADADVSTIHFSTERPHYIKTVRKHPNSAFLRTWGFDTSSDSVDESYATYDFYVPKGTIKHNYVLDAE